MNKKIESMVINMVVGNLLYLANGLRDDMNKEEASNLESLAIKVTGGSATEEEWAEIISQISISEN